MAEITVVALTAVLVLVTAWYAWLTKRIAEASERSARTAVEAAEAAARSAATAEAALLAQSMPFVRPSFDRGWDKTEPARTGFVQTMSLTNSGRHAALNVELSIGYDLLHTFSIVEPGQTVTHRWSNDETAKRLYGAKTATDRGWLLSTRYSDPYGNRYEVEFQRVAAGGVAPEERVSTYRLAPDGTRTPLLGP